MTDIWQAKTYSKFLDARTRPAKDLLNAIPAASEPKLVYDLGSGPGNSTILLKERWPEAHIIGVDNSEDMLQEARVTYPDLEFVLGDIAAFAPKEKADCIFANASLQWLGNHDILIPKLLSFLRIGGVLAIQIPNNFHYPSHQVTLDILENNPDWQHLISEISSTLRYGKLSKPFYDPAWYYDLFSKAKVSNIQLWETEYIQEMDSHQAIFDWTKGTGLRPVLAKLSSIEQEKFATLYIAGIKKAYPLQPNGKVLFPFRRFFMVALK